MKSLRDKGSILKIDRQELLKYGKHIYDSEMEYEFDPDYLGISESTVYINGKEMVLQKENFEGNVNPDWFTANNLAKEQLDNKSVETIYFDENGQMFEDIEELEQKVNGVIEGANKKSEDMHKHKVINFFKALFSKKKLLKDNNSLTLEEIDERLARVAEKEKNFMSNYSTEKTDAEKSLDVQKVVQEHTPEIIDERV